MLTARERIARQMADPFLVRLHRKLSRLKSTVTMMNTGAHPDDEQSGMLAWFRLGLGIRIVIACSTRGEGGQNGLGAERLGALGVMRSRELEEAARAMDVDVSWLGHGPADPVHDFGFSKDGNATFARWGEARTVERLVRAYRAERPDIVIPTFLDVPGQHGHHRAMTRAAETAIALAADPNAFPEHLEQGLAPWSVAKYYLPAWSGGGGTYDDEVPPPKSTVTVLADGRDPATGAEYDRIGEWSRFYHASQDMGHWPKQAGTAWALHLKLSAQGLKAEGSVLNGLPKTLSALGGTTSLPRAVADDLLAADAAIAAAIAAFPDRDAVIAALNEAAVALERVAADAPGDFTSLHGHRIARKRREIDAAILEAAAIFERAYADPPAIVPGGTSVLTVELGEGATGRAIDVVAVLPAGVSSSASRQGRNWIFALSATADSALTSLYLPDLSALGGNGHAHVGVTAEIAGRSVTGRFDLEEPFSVQPAQSLVLRPDALIVPMNGKTRAFPIKIDLDGTPAAISFRVPAGWTMEKTEGGWTASATDEPKPSLVEIVPEVDGRPAWQATPIAYPHIGRTSFRQPAALRVLSLDLSLPRDARIAYIGGGADRVGLWLSRMDLDVTELDADALAGDLSRYSTIVIGIFAFGIRKDLTAATPRLHRFVEEGGHLVTLYHRPSDGWNPDETPVRRIEIGSPSLRWRVTDPGAEVTVLSPGHMLLNGPNVITRSDWQGWDKERGLYFASGFDEVYEPLLAMHDVNEQPLKGAMISGTIGKGRHTHTSLVLHHQMDRLVPGAFRLMANLVQPA
nr:PIG-L family deacetylase [Rhizobium sp. TCK]